MAFKNVFLCLQTKKGKFGKEIMNIWDMLIIDPMINALLGIYSFVGNFGIAIILFTLLIRLVTFPLTRSQIKGTTAMQDMQKSPEFLKLKKKYKDDKQKLQQAQMELYKEKGINPLGSCLPTLIQFPIIIGLYRAVIMALAVTPTQMLELNSHAYPFINISKLVMIDNQFLWMDLSQPERLSIFGIDLFGIGGIPVLAIIVVITTFLQTRLMTPPSQPGEQGAQMTQMMNLYMPLLMGYLAFSFAAGLALYFVTSNLATIGSYAAMGRLNWDNLIPKRKGKAKDG
jgi:YidC/Oxa1 family membrane protein insertase